MDKIYRTGQKEINGVENVINGGSLFISARVYPEVETFEMKWPEKKGMDIPCA